MSTIYLKKSVFTAHTSLQNLPFVCNRFEICLISPKHSEICQLKTMTLFTHFYFIPLPFSLLRVQNGFLKENPISFWLYLDNTWLNIDWSSLTSHNMPTLCAFESLFANDFVYFSVMRKQHTIFQVSILAVAWFKMQFCLEKYLCKRSVLWISVD